MLPDNAFRRRYLNNNTSPPPLPSLPLGEGCDRQARSPSHAPSSRFSSDSKIILLINRRCLRAKLPLRFINIRETIIFPRTNYTLKRGKQVIVATSGYLKSSIDIPEICSFLKFSRSRNFPFYFIRT